MELKPGNETSEFSLTKLIVFGGLAIDVISVVLESLKNVGLNFGWLPAVLAVCGSAMALLKGLGYTRSRTMAKLVALQPQAEEVAGKAIPFAKSLRDVIREELALAKAKDVTPSQG